MYSYEGILKGHPEITYRQSKVDRKEKWLYSFRDYVRVAKEEKDYLSRSVSGFSDSELKAKQERLGTIVLDSNLDMTAEEIYLAYSKRWEIETVMRYYKQSCEFDETRVHDKYSVYTTEFRNFLLSLLTYRLPNRSKDTGLLEEYTSEESMHRLRRAKKVRTDEKEGFALVRLNPSTMNVLERLRLVSTSPHRRSESVNTPKNQAYSLIR